MVAAFQAAHDAGKVATREDAPHTAANDGRNRVSLTEADFQKGRAIGTDKRRQQGRQGAIGAHAIDAAIQSTPRLVKSHFRLEMLDLG